MKICYVHYKKINKEQHKIFKSLAGISELLKRALIACIFIKKVYGSVVDKPLCTRQLVQD